MSKKKLIIFTDSGDTIIDEGSEKRPYDEIVYEAECIPGAKETYQRLKKEGYTLILVADGYTESFDRVYRFQQLEDLFDARVTSEAVGAEKPSAKMFEAAMKAAGLTGRDKKRILMVGNNLSRDILGANRFGITSVLMRWSPRYPMEPETEEETPDYIINTPSELEALAARLEAQLEEEELAFALKYCPYIFFDKKEPIPLRRIGYQVFTSTSPSDSFPRTVQVKNGETVIEYAFFWDYDIQHMYDLEHIWVTVDSAGQICGCQASFHGQRLNMMWDRDNSLKTENQTHVCLYSQPGKTRVHAASGSVPSVSRPVQQLHGRSRYFRPGCPGAVPERSAADGLAKSDNKGTHPGDLRLLPIHGICQASRLGKPSLSMGIT